MTRKHALVAALLGLIAASGAFPVAALATDATVGKVTGFVSYEETDILSPTAVITVTLIDTSRADAPADVVGRQVIQANGLQVPVAFEIDFDPAKIEAGHRYAIQARIEDDGELQFISDRVYPVLTHGAPASANLVLKQVPQD